MEEHEADEHHPPSDEEIELAVPPIMDPAPDPDPVAAL